MQRGIGIDFGTTNSALAVATPRAETEIAHFASASGPTTAFRSVLYSGRDDREGPVESLAGPRAIERYLEAESERRLMQSLKSFLASRLFQATNLFGRRTTLEELIARILSELKREVEAGCETLAGRLMVGRPVRFAKAKTSDDDDYAQGRLARALERAGFSEFGFEYEPVAAAYHYEQDLDADELVLIADFGGGTSDFCLLRVGPDARSRGRRAQDILGTEGVAIAGDAFDAKIVRNVVAPRLGRGSQKRALFGKPLKVPNWIYSDLERWHHLSFLRSPKTLGILYDVLRTSTEPDKIRALIHVVESELGFQLYRSVEAVKTELSNRDESRFVFSDPPAHIEATVTRADFESWIAEDVREIEACVERLFARTRIETRQVDRVFLTGGSSFVPAVRAIFERRFGRERTRTGGELISVASGLALRALDER